MLGALCFGTAFGFPFITWGLFLIFDRDRTWQKKIEKNTSKTALIRTQAWDTRQIIYGSILLIIGIIILFSLVLFNLTAQSLTPVPTP
jgi:hypothetical protein